MLIVASLFCGFVFGLGLLISGMMQPTKVLGFLDIFGAWDSEPRRGDGGGARGVGRRLHARATAPGSRCWRPSSISRPRPAIDTPLIAGSALFGIGWGLVGLCPGPALENLATLSPQVIVFCIAMTAGMIAHDHWYAKRPATPPSGALAKADG